jgi:inosine-uridine nucleoside N-ribohydrolase
MRQHVTMPTKVILDVDTGTDDAVALMTAALSPDIELVGATSVNGNTGVDYTTENTLRVFDWIGMPEIPVSRGMGVPIVGAQPDLGMAAVIHQNLLDLPPCSRGATLRPEHAVDWLIETYLASDGDIVLCPVGPLTNIAMAIQKEPRMLEAIPEIVIMGGAHQMGNRTHSAEFNFLIDPEAARVVVNCGRPIRMVSLDATHRAMLSTEDAQKLRDLGTVRSAADRRLRSDPANPRSAWVCADPRRACGVRHHRPDHLDDRVHPRRCRGPRRAIRRAHCVRLPHPPEQARQCPFRYRR